jgi:hypothetical protein
MAGGSPLEDQVTIKNAELLEELVAWNWPDLLWLDIEWHSPQAATLWVLDLDYKYTRWLACLSLDQRWTLSPR